MHNKTPVHSTWGLLRVCAACSTARLNLSSELRPSWNNIQDMFLIGSAPDTTTKTVNTLEVDRQFSASVAPSIERTLSDLQPCIQLISLEMWVSDNSTKEVIS
jgi:hypothetical protein